MMLKINSLPLKRPLNRPLNRQGGASTFGILFTILFCGFLLFLAVKLIPPYLEHWRIAKAVDLIATKEGVRNYRKSQIVGMIDTTVDRNSAYVGVTRELDKMVKLTSSNGKKVIQLKYEVVVPFFYNFSALLDFFHQAEINPRIKLDNG